MNFTPNLNFAEIFLRYAMMMAVGILIGVLRVYWAIPFMMIIFLSAMMGYCPVKQAFKSKKQIQSADSTYG
jgi:hypothetical protein